MADKKKKKRDFISTFQSVERYHRRRSAFVIHATLSLAFQVTMWINWYGSYAAHGQGFESTFLRIGSASRWHCSYSWRGILC